MNLPAALDKNIKSFALRWARRLLCSLLLLFIILLLALFGLYQTQLKPSSDQEWAYFFKTPLINIPISVPKALIFMSSPRIAPWLNDVSQKTSVGTLQLNWEKASQQLTVNCAPCTANFNSLSTTPIELDQVQITLKRTLIAPEERRESVKNSIELNGQIFLGDEPPLVFEWSSLLAQHEPTFKLNLVGHHIKIDSIYQMFTSELEGLEQAKIEGDFDITAELSLPSFSLTLSEITPNQFKVTGLETKKLLESSPSCGPEIKIPLNSWIARSVMAAEDQRFEHHAGFDLEELIIAHNLNREHGGIVRGGSTITQQVAKLIYTGNDKTLERKLRELLYAVEMEQTLSKEKIMQLYLNNAPWGVTREGTVLCGAQAASRHFFQVDAIDLKPTQAIWLAAMLHSPMREAKQWQESGKINLNRAIWVAGNVRNIAGSTPKDRQIIIDELKRDPSLGMRASGL